MRWDNGDSVAAGALITLIAMRRFVCSAASGVTGGEGSEMELEPVNWKPLERLIGYRCGEFMWMWRENGLEHYKHIDSRRYLILDAEGRCYGRQGAQLVRVDFREEFQRVTEAIGV
jgi:hypothetical protein